MKNTKIRKCKRCANVAIKSEVEGYSYTCESCDEDLYTFETYEETVTTSK